MKANKVFFHQPVAESLQESLGYLHIRKWHNGGKGIEDLSFSAPRHNTSLLPDVGCVRQGLIKINIKVSDSLSNLNRRELGVAP